MVIKRRKADAPLVVAQPPVFSSYGAYRIWLWEQQKGYERFNSYQQTYDGRPVREHGDVVFIQPRSNENFKDCLHCGNPATAFKTVALLCGIGRDEIREIHMNVTDIYVKFHPKYEPHVLEGQPVDSRTKYSGKL